MVDYKFMQVYIPPGCKEPLHLFARRPSIVRKKRRPKPRPKVILCEECRYNRRHTATFLDWCADKLTNYFNMPSQRRRGCPFCIPARVIEVRRQSW